MSDGVVIPSSIQDEIAKQMEQGNPNGIDWKWSKYGLSIHNLYPEPVYSFYLGCYACHSMKDLIEAHNQEIGYEGYVGG